MTDRSLLARLLMGTPGYDADTAPQPLQPIYSALAPDPNADYGSILPFARDKTTGEKRWAMPEMVRNGLFGALDALAGTETGQLTDRAAQSVTLGGLGTGMALAPSTAATLAAGGRGIRAFHGSPHNFNKFDLSKIGTGEGAQAYGHGLYFAENEAVAKGYRNQLAKGYESTQGALPTDIQSALEYVHPKYKANGDIAGGVTDAIARMKDQAEFYRKNYGPGPNLYDAAAERLAAIDPSTLKPAGHMYEVNINADPARFLDWDKPLSGQSVEVKNALKPFGFRDPSGELRLYDDALLDALAGGNTKLPRQPSDPTGGAIYESPKIVPGGYRDPAAASNALREAGIPGIKYLDQGSRTAGQGSSNYVVNDDSIIDIIRKYMMGAPAPVAAPGARPSTEETAPNNVSLLARLLAQKEY